MSFIDIAVIVGGVATEGLVGAGIGAETAGAIGTGLGAAAEGAVTGSAMGAATSALTGQDPGKGALFGALGGGALSGLGSAVGSIGGEAVGAGSAAAPETAGVQAAKTAEQVATPGNMAQFTGPVSNAEAFAPNAAESFAGRGTTLGDLAKQAGFGTPEAPTMSEVPSMQPGSEAAIRSRLANSLYGQHNLMIPGIGATLGTMLGGNSTSQATPPGQDWNPLGDYKFNMRRFNPQPSGYTGYLYGNPGFAEGGIAALGSADPAKGATDSVDFMGGDMYPGSQQKMSFYNSPSQMPMSAQQAMASYEPKTNPLTGEATAHMAQGGIAQLSVGGKLLKGHGDGMSDGIHANIDGKQQARLADGEFVVPADVVSHLGNGSTDAGAKHLYAMMDKVRKARTGREAQGREINPSKYMPA